MSESKPPQPPELPASAAEPLPSLAEQIVELSALTGGLAHEIRNPLSTMKVNLQLLDEDWRQVESADEDRLCDPTEIARRSRGRIANLLDEANHLERILQEFMQCVGKRELRRSPVDLNQLVGDLVDFYRPQAEAHDIVLRLAASKEPLTVKVDQNVLKQALLNLLINAQQAMPEGGEVYVHLTQHSGTVARIDVIDCGPGIPESQRERIFQAYYSTKKGGSGLGLATTRQIIREHGGRIHLHSEPPQGSCFTILLPRSS
ncbi:MAG: HAMP domain-containing sensor histidine kinase [Planctomycetota bacterium]